MKTIQITVAALLFASPVQAACGLPNISGNWTALVSTPTAHAGCDLTVNGSTVTGTCVDSAAVTSTPTGSFTSLNPAKCLFTGSLTINSVAYTINLAAMNNDKQTLHGIGMTATPGPFQLTMVKQAGRKGPGGGPK